MDKVWVVSMLREAGLERLSRAILEEACVKFGLSPAGSRKDVIKRLRKEISRDEYNVPDGVTVLTLDGDPRKLFNTIAEALGEPHD
jgi:hypothetical protein